MHAWCPCMPTYLLESHSAIPSVHSDVFVLLCPTECDSIGISFEIHTNSRGNHALGLSPSCAISTTIRDESLKSYSSLVHVLVSCTVACKL